MSFTAYGTVRWVSICHPSGSMVGAVEPRVGLGSLDVVHEFSSPKVYQVRNVDVGVLICGASIMANRITNL